MAVAIPDLMAPLFDAMREETAAGSIVETMDINWLTCAIMLDISGDKEEGSEERSPDPFAVAVEKSPDPSAVAVEKSSDPFEVAVGAFAEA